MSNNLSQAPEWQIGNYPRRGGKLIIPELNGLRGIAILGVIFFHSMFNVLSSTSITYFGIWFTPYLTSGWHGVNLFFVLSAFVLFLPYVAGDRDMRAAGSVWRFYRQRALRLLPAYYLIVIIEMSFVNFPFGSATLSRASVGVLTFTFSLMPDMWIPGTTNLALWSLGTEALFSVAFPLLCWLALRFGAVRVLAVSIPVGFLFRLLGYYLGPPEPISWLEGMLVGRIDEFLWGFLLAEMFVRGRIPRHPYLFFALGMAILLLVEHAYARLIASSPLFHEYLALYVILFDIAVALFIAAALAGRSLWSDFLNMRWLRVLGMACYSLYLWHLPLMFMFHIPQDPGHLPSLAGYIVCLCVLAGITYRFVEFRSVADWRSLFLLNEPRGKRRLDRIVDPAHSLAKLVREVE